MIHNSIQQAVSYDELRQQLMFLKIPQNLYFFWLTFNFLSGNAPSSQNTTMGWKRLSLATILNSQNSLTPKTRPNLGIIYLVPTQNFLENSHFYPLIRTRACMYHWLWNVKFSKNFAYVLNRGSVSNKNNFITFLVEPRRRKKKTKKIWRAWFECC